METTQIQHQFNFQNHSQLPINRSSYRGALNPIRKLEIVAKKNHIEIKVRIDGLWGKNYKIEATEQCLTLTALRYVFDESSENKKTRGKFRWITSSLFLPYQVEEGNIVSELKDGYLNIRIPHNAEYNSAQNFIMN